MNILILTHTFSDKVIGGEARISWELPVALAKRGLNVFVVTPYVEKNITDKLFSNLRVYKVPFCHPSPGLDASNMLRMFFYSLPLIFLKKIDIIHLISSNGPCPFSKFKFGKKFVESADISHNYHDPLIKEELWEDRLKKKEADHIDYKPGIAEKIFDKFTSLFYGIFGLNEIYPRGTDLFACRATKIINYLKGQNYRAELVYIPNGVDIEKFRPQISLNTGNNRFTFLFVGKLTKTKGLAYLLDAFNRLSENNKFIDLLLIGGGASSTVKYFTEKSKENKNIHFLGIKSADEIKNYYMSCDIFIMPSLSEGFGIANLEAMACGKPVISTRVGGIVDVVVDGETGLLVNPANVNELYLAMEKFLDNPGMVIKMGGMARKRVVENFSWNIVAEKLHNAYASILSYEKQS